MKELLSLMIFTCVIGIVGPAPVQSSEVRVLTEVSRNKVAIGSSINYSISVKGSQDVSPVLLPSLDGFESRYDGQSTQVSIVNGAYESSITFNYSLFPVKTGQFTIPGFELTVAGRPYRTEAVMVDVLDSSATKMTNQQADPSGIGDRVFISMKAAKDEVFINERVPVKVLLFVNEIAVRDIQYPQFDGVGFVIEEFGKPKQYQQNVNGLRYDIVEFDTVIYPTRTGELNLGKAAVDCNLLYRSSDRQSSFGRMGGLFDDEFFRDFFDRYEKRPVTLESDEVMIHVKDLPEEGKPVGFMQAVGNYNFEVQVGPTDVKEGDPITVKMKVSGEGNLRAVQFPQFPATKDFKYYAPNITEQDGMKVSEQVLIPTNAGVTAVPAIAFSYFDTNLKKYRTVTRGPFPVNVTELKDGERIRVVGSAVPAAEPEVLGSDIIFIKEDAGRLRRINKAFYKSKLFYVLLILYAAGWFFAFSHYKKTHKIATDKVYARRLQAPKYAKKGLQEAKGYLNHENGKEFYDAVFKTLQLYFSHKLHLPAGSVAYEKVSVELGGYFVTDSVKEDVKTLFEECDSIRYASVNVGKAQMAKSYESLERIIDHLERKMK